MQFKRKYFWLIGLVVFAGVLWYAYSEYHRKPADLSSLKPIAVLDARSLVNIYENDEQKANALYLGKPIDVAGIISEINNQQDTMINILLGDKNDMHRVSCLLDLKYLEEIKKYKAGDKVTIRGICTGYLLDVELNRCVPVDHKTEI